MTTALEVVGVAFVAQLLVLPGEKVQFIIAGLATRYRPLVVVGAAGSAFAGWTALEIAFGNALQRLLSAALLDLITAGLFFLFALLLYRAAPAATVSRTVRPSQGTDSAEHLHPEPDLEPRESTNKSADTTARADGQRSQTDGPDLQILGRQLPESYGAFPAIFAMMAVGEFGDKTQLVTIGLAAQYGAHPGIWVGEMLAILPVSLANAMLFHRFAGVFNARKAHLAGAAVFLFFGLDTLMGLTLGFSVWETAVESAANAIAG